MARHKHDRNRRKGELYLEKAFRGDHSIKRGNYYYLASFPWEEICYIVIFPEGRAFYHFFFGIPRDDWGNGAVQHWYTVGMSRSTGVLEYSTTARPHRSSTKI